MSKCVKYFASSHATMIVHFLFYNVVVNYKAQIIQKGESNIVKIHENIGDV